MTAAAIPFRAALLVPAGVGLLAGLDAALLLLGLPAPVASDRLPGLHGMLMVVGFLGTLIALERAVALRAWWGYLAPTLLGAATILLLLPVPTPLGRSLFVAGLATLVAVYAVLWRRQFDDVVLVQLLGALFAVCAALLWLRVDVSVTLPYLVAFLVLTIAAERVELTRLHLPRSTARVLFALALALLVAAVMSTLWPAVGSRGFAVVLLALVVWLAPRDVAVRMVRRPGLPRFSAAALLGGYAWLVTGALVWTGTGPPVSAAAYDTVVHAVGLGFAMSMVMAHASVIFPAVVRRPLDFHAVQWVPLGLLHLGLAVRVVGGAAGAEWWWRAGAVTTGVALLAFVLVVAASAARPRERRPADPAVTS